MNHRINVAHEAEKALDRLDRPAERRIRQRIVLLAEDPFDHRLSAPLTEPEGLRRSRVGGWRILFSVDRATKVLYLLTVETRGQVYTHPERLSASMAAGENRLGGRELFQ